MTSELILHLTTLLNRWEHLSNAAANTLERTDQPVQDGFYAGVLFGMNVAREELATALAAAIAETAKPTANITYQ